MLARRAPLGSSLEIFVTRCTTCSKLRKYYRRPGRLPARGGRLRGKPTGEPPPHFARTGPGASGHGRARGHFSFAAERPPQVEAANPGGGLMLAAFARTGHKGAGERLRRVSRQALAAGRAGVGIHLRYRTPVNAILFTAGVALALALSGSFAWLAIASAVARLVTYGASCGAAVALGRPGLGWGGRARRCLSRPSRRSCPCWAWSLSLRSPQAHRARSWPLAWRRFARARSCSWRAGNRRRPAARRPGLEHPAAPDRRSSL